MSPVMVNGQIVPLLKKLDCLIEGNPKLISFFHYRIWKMQSGDRKLLKDQEEKQALIDMNS
jgi:hypothetical protein